MHVLILVVFQSRNRESSNFNLIDVHENPVAVEFQSRNRESSNFNLRWIPVFNDMYICFNLVIENLLISTHVNTTENMFIRAFQSRNRESSNFNRTAPQPLPSSNSMFQSRNRESSNFNDSLKSPIKKAYPCFNLVIENLLISTTEKDILTILVNGQVSIS